MSISHRIKQLLKGFVKRSPIPLTKGQRIDHLTRRIIQNNLKPSSNCVDVGAHSGEILDFILKAAPNGQHFAFEPLPHLYESLVANYGQQVHVMPYALSDNSGTTTFQYVVSNPAYSGLKQRKYDRKHEDVREIEVEVRQMDACLPEGTQIDFIKIDVEGAELFTLRGATQILDQWHPILLFEHGKGGADSYGYAATEIWQFLHDRHGYRIYTLDGYIHDKSALTLAALDQHFNKGDEFYFIALWKEKEN